MVACGSHLDAIWNILKSTLNMQNITLQRSKCEQSFLFPEMLMDSHLCMAECWQTTWLQQYVLVLKNKGFKTKICAFPVCGKQMIFGVPTSRCAQSLKYFKTTVLEIWLAQGIHSLFLKKKIIQKNPFFSSFWEKKNLHWNDRACRVEVSRSAKRQINWCEPLNVKT